MKVERVSESKYNIMKRRRTLIRRETKSLKLKGIIFNWAAFMGDTASVHGLSWFNYFDKPLIKGVVLAFALGCFCFIPTYTYVALKEFIQDESIFSKVVTRELEEVRFPFITLCHPFYFQKIKMQGDFLFVGTIG